MHALNLIHSSVQSAELPFFVEKSLTTLCRVRSFWRWYRAIEVYGNPGHFNALIQGRLLHFAFGDSLAVKIAAQVVMVCQRIILAVQSKNRLAQSCQRLKTLCCKPLDRRLFGHKIEGSRLISPSTAFWYYYNVHPLFVRLHKIAICALKIIVQLFETSMRILDAYDAVILDPTAKKDAVPEFFLNTKHCLQTLADNKQTLLQELQLQRPLIEKILKNSPLQFSHLYSAVEKSANCANAAEVAVDGARRLGRAGLLAGRNLLCDMRNLFTREP